MWTKEEKQLVNTVEKLGQQTESLAKIIQRIDSSRPWSLYAHPWRFMMFSFLNGLMIVLGSTIGLALFIYFLGLLGYLPVFGEFFAGIRGLITN